MPPQTHFLAHAAAVPARIARALLPDDRVAARRRGPGAGDVPAGLEILRGLRGQIVGADLAAPHRHQHLPDRAGGQATPAAADRAGQRRVATRPTTSPSAPRCLAGATARRAERGPVRPVGDRRVPGVGAVGIRCGAAASVAPAAGGAGAARGAAVEGRRSRRGHRHVDGRRQQPAAAGPRPARCRRADPGRPVRRARSRRRPAICWPATSRRSRTTTSTAGGAVHRRSGLGDAAVRRLVPGPGRHRRAVQDSLPGRTRPATCACCHSPPTASPPRRCTCAPPRPACTWRSSCTCSTCAPTASRTSWRSSRTAVRNSACPKRLHGGIRRRPTRRRPRHDQDGLAGLQALVLVRRLLRPDEHPSRPAAGQQRRHRRAGSRFRHPPAPRHGDRHLGAAGSLVHQDSTGHSGVIYPGLAQRMSAGTRHPALGEERVRQRACAFRSDVGGCPTNRASSPATSSLEIDDELCAAAW